MKNRLLPACLAIILLASTNIFAEYVFTKDGKIHQGSIISETADEIIVRKKNNKAVKIKRRFTMRILYTELYMGKVYVQQYNGDTLVVYMVDEDRENYTFRKDINKPDEFKVKRSKVQFIARGNPAELSVEGEPGQTNANLKWFAPNNKVKKYRIYLKAKGEKDFTLFDDTSFTGTKVKKLKSNTNYIARVTAIDPQGDETPPSNEVKFKTANRPPDAPEELSCVNISKENEPVQYKVSWSEAIDSDSKVSAYRLYKIENKRKELVREFKTQHALKKREYVFKINEKIDAVIITAVDDLGAESKEKRLLIDANRGLFLQTDIIAVFPDKRSYLYEYSKFGYGLGVTFGMSNIFFKGVEMGANLQFINFVPENDYAEDESKVNSLFSFPLTPYIGYSYTFFGRLKLMAALHFGALLLYLDLQYYDLSVSDSIEEQNWEVTGLLGIELKLQYDFTDSIFVDITGRYYRMYEGENALPYYQTGIGAGYRF